jgi:hypothetical protein
MAGYRVYFLGRDNRIEAREEFEAEGDQEAVTKARLLFGYQAHSSGFEVWRLDRRVHQEMR